MKNWPSTKSLSSVIEVKDAQSCGHNVANVEDIFCVKWQRRFFMTETKVVFQNVLVTTYLLHRFATLEGEVSIVSGTE